MPTLLDELCFTVDQWSDDGGRLESTLSCSSNALLALGAFHEAVKLRPHSRLTMRHKSRVIASHTPEKLRIAEELQREELERQIAARNAARRS